MCGMAPSSSNNIVCSQPRIQRDSSGRKQKCQFFSVSRMDSLVLWRLLEADGLSITLGKGCEKLKMAEVNKLFGTEMRK